LNPRPSGPEPDALPLRYTPMEVCSGARIRTWIGGSKGRWLTVGRHRIIGSRVRTRTSTTCVRDRLPAISYTGSFQIKCPVAKSNRALRLFRSALVTMRASGAKGGIGFPPTMIAIWFSQNKKTELPSFVHPEGLEPTANRLRIGYSFQLSYGCSTYDFLGWVMRYSFMYFLLASLQASHDGRQYL
jgi:hypothetical protein